MYQLVLILLISVSAIGQVQFTVETDTSIYEPSATIQITGTATNISGENITLNWPTGCQFNYYLGSWPSYTSPNYACYLAYTWVTLEPGMSHSWEVFHTSEDTVMAPGNYAITGFLNDDEFRLTPPAFINIGETEDPFYKTGYAPPADSMLLVNGGCTPVVLIPVVEQVSEDLDLVRIHTGDNSWYVYKPVDSLSISPYPWGAGEFYFYIRDSLDYSYELLLLNEWENSTLNFDEENHLWVDGDCTYRLLISHEDVVVDTIDYAFKARMTANTNPEITMPAIFNIEAYPSPFNPLTTIAFELLEQGDVDVNIFDLTGRLVWSTTLNTHQPGRHELKWNGQDTWGGGVPSGIYIIQIEAGSVRETTKVVMLK
ncbi:MAG: T9SS type A sorting domain-containing protein [Candidatus Marinimicrobia bacterium]|nr:T9SS type A sorting domain-containing protein [Candidatus Neomarinimicrobiota bacterium]